MHEYTVYLTVSIYVSADGQDEAEEKAMGLLRDVGITIVDDGIEVVQWREC